MPSWLKSLRLHKYAALFSQMSYEEMMTLTEQHLESQVNLREHWGGGGPAQLAAVPSSSLFYFCSLLGYPYVPYLFSASCLLLSSSQNVTKGARHKIALSIQKLRERQSVLKSLEKVRPWYHRLKAQWFGQVEGFRSILLGTAI